MLVSRNAARITRLLYTEILFSSVPGGIIAFNAAYLLRLGASNLHVSLLTALPALAAVVISVPAGHFLQSRAQPHWWTLACLAIYWTGFFSLAFVPWVHVAGLSAGTVAIIFLGLASLPTQIFNVGIFPLLADLVPTERRVHVFAVRGIISSSVISVVTLVVGQWLDRVAFPVNYQTAYTAGWFGGLACVSLLIVALRLHQREAAARAAQAPRPVVAAPPPARRFWPEDLWQQRDFIFITLNTFLHSLAGWLATALYVLYFVRQLGVDDAWLGLYGTVANLSNIAGLLVWRRVAVRWGEARTLRLTVLSVGVMPLLVGLIANPAAILVVTAINGFFNGGITVSHINVVLNTIPADRRPHYMGLYSALLNAGAFAFPLLSVALAGWLGLAPTLVLCGVVGLAGATSHWIWRVPSTVAARAPASEPGIEGV